MRNKHAIEGKFPRSLSEIIFKINMFLQKWKPLLRSGEQLKLEEMVSQIRGLVEKLLERLKECPPDEVFI